MMKKSTLLLNALTKYFVGLIAVGLLLFLPAGSLYFVNGWIFIGLLFVPMLIAGFILMAKNPELLAKRLNAKEEQSEQKGVVLVSGVMFLSGFIVAGLNYRFSWHTLPKWIVIVSAVIFLLSYAMYGEVLRENTYLSRTVEVQENQKVIDTGLYGIIRHPMYTATILLFLSIPLILNSLFSFLIFLIYPFVIVVRLKNEEKLLEKELHGYTEYQQKVKYRLIPFIW